MRRARRKPDRAGANKSRCGLYNDSALHEGAIAVLQKKLVAKDSHPWMEDGIHDFMHNKLVVVDDALITGSHNFSLSAQSNAENALLIRESNLAGRYREYVEQVVKRYS